ncbi:MAG: hypothetical protein WCI46_14785, partial [Verrucomicrobiota bacterium]
NFVSGAVTVNVGSTLTLDDTGSANLSNRLGNVGVTLSGGTFVSTANAAGSTESTTGALTLNTGESTVTLNQGAVSNVTTFGSLSFGTGGSATFAGTNLATASNKIIITSAPGLTGNILPRLAVGTEFATYNQDGLGVANTNGVQAISAAASSSPTDINTALTSANLKLTPAVTTRDLTAARTVNSVNIADNSVNIGTNGSLLPTQGLLISTGAVIVNGTGAVISTPVTNMNAEGIFRVNSGQDLTVNSRIGSTQALTKTGSGNMTIGRLADYIGTTTVNQGTLKFGTGIGSNPLQVSVTTGAPTVQTLQMNGGTLDLNGNKLLVGQINGSNNFTGGTITNNAGGSAVTLTSFSGGGTFGGTITGNLNFTHNGNNVFSGAALVLKNEQSYTGATVVRGGRLTLQDKGALYSGVSLANASVELNYASILFDNSGLNAAATPPARIPSTVPITLKNAMINVTPGASADNVTTLGTVTVDRGQNYITLNTANNVSGATLTNGSGATNVMTIDNLANNGNGGIISLLHYSNQTGSSASVQGQRLVINNVNGSPVTAGTMLPAWVAITGTSNTNNANGWTDFATLSSTGYGIVGYGDTSRGAPGYVGTFASGNVTSVGATVLSAASTTTKALQTTGALTFSAATNTLNIESGGFLYSGGTATFGGAVVDTGVVTAGGTASSGTTDLVIGQGGNNNNAPMTLNFTIKDTSTVIGSGTAKVRLVLTSANSTIVLTGHNTYSGGTIVTGGREGGAPLTIPASSSYAVIPAGGLTLYALTNGGGNSKLDLTAPGQINAANDVNLVGGFQLNMNGTNTLASLNFNNIGGNTAPGVATATALTLSKTTAQGSAITSVNDNINNVPTVSGTSLVLQDGATITTSGEAPVSLSISAALTFTGATSPLIKAGSGSLLITGTNTSANGFNLNAGTIILSSTANA